MSKSQNDSLNVDIPVDLDLRLPQGVHERLQNLLDRQEQGENLTSAERLEAEGLVNLAESLSLIRSCAEAVSR